MIPLANYARDIAHVIVERTWFYKKPDSFPVAAFYTGKNPVKIKCTACSELVCNNPDPYQHRYMVVFTRGYWVEIEMVQRGLVLPENPPEICEVVVYGGLQPSKSSGYPRRRNLSLAIWQRFEKERLEVWKRNLKPFMPSFEPFYKELKRYGLAG